MYPRISINLNKLKHNLDYLTNLCHSNGLSIAVVTKVFCADKEITKLISESDADYFADSRIENLKNCPSNKEKILLRISSPSFVDDVVKYSDISLQSEITTINLLGEAAKKQNKRHKVVLMIDLGDLREGIFYKNLDDIYAACECVLSHDKLELFGIGVNLTCYGGILPSAENLGNLVNIADKIRTKYNIELPFVSGGNSSTLEFLKAGGVPKGITNLRLGESFVLGNDTAVCKVMDGLFGDAMILEAELIEKKLKPSKPIGTSGKNAFGEEVHFDDKGDMIRGILAIGRQDMIIDGICPLDKKIEIIGASSDHLLVDLTQNSSYNIGDVLKFTMEYGSVLHGFTSAYVNREYIK